ncbi:MAG: M20/M25/M40 family metallo-hydrolase [Alphaproteobacteria bacterium]|nr:M20/M25/M40 family metallo-hydrolase [Alphaproteobacteria bacterium]
MRPTLIAVLFAVFSVSTSEAQDDAMAAADAYQQAHEQQILEEAFDFLALPNNAANRDDILVNARHIVAMLEARGADAQILEASDSLPAVYGEILTPGATRTVMFYAHYDGQPALPENWTYPPFEPVMLSGRIDAGGAPVDWRDASVIDPDWRIYARSSSDDKSPIVALLTAIDALVAADIPLGVNIKFFFEGEEEAGSAHMRTMLETHRDLLAADFWVLADGPVDPRGDPRIVLGVRGVTSMQLTVHGASRDLHSGHYGNVAPNPAARLAHLIASMRAPDGRVLIDGFYDGVPAPSDAALALIESGAYDEDGLVAEPGIAGVEWRQGASYGEAVMVPALNILGLSSAATGDATRNAIPSTATAAIGFRMVPGQTIPRIRELVTAHLESEGYVILDRAPTPEERLAHPMIAEIHWSTSGYPAAVTQAEHPDVIRLTGLVASTSDRPVRVVPILGGSLPLAPIVDVLDVPFAIVPMVNPDNSQHAPDENLRVGHLWDGIRLYAVLMADDWED